MKSVFNCQDNSYCLPYSTDGWVRSIIVWHYSICRGYFQLSYHKCQRNILQLETTERCTT